MAPQTIGPALPNFPEVQKYEYSGTDERLRFPVHNPATGEIITTVQAGDAETVAKAVAAAKIAYATDWRHRPLIERSALLLKCADKLEAHKTELAALLCLENGKPFHDAVQGDCAFLHRIFAYFGSLVDKLPSQLLDRGQFYVSAFREPHGVCAGILPFNWPPIHTGGKVAPCIAMGNTIVLKPGEQAPLTVMRIVEILNEVLPPGVVQAVPGVGLEVPQALVTHPDVKMVSFTGSTAAGVAISKAVAPQMKHLALELGGKNAMLIFDDADLDRAARSIIDGAFYNKGEACTAASRVLIQASIHDQLVERVAAGIRKLRVGNGMHAETHVGPQVTAAQQEKVLQWIETAKMEGAEVAAQAQLPDDPACKGGFFVAPTLLTNVKRTHQIAQEEVFGAVVTVTKFETEDEAIEIANESRYGLVGSVFTKDSEKGLRVCRRLETGMVFLNNYNRNVLGLPFGGVKDSGRGREHTIETLNEWSTAKFIQMPSGKGSPLKSWKPAEEVFAGKPPSLL